MLIESEVQLPLSKIHSPSRPLDLCDLLDYERNGSLQTRIAPAFEDWVNIFLENSSHKDKSMKGRILHWADCFRGYKVTEITADMVEIELLNLSRSISGSSVNRYKSNLSSVFAYLNKSPKFRSLKCRNPVRSEFVSSFPENAHRDIFLSPSQQKHLLNESRNSHWPLMHLFILFALSTGARKSEILNLTWKDIDPENNTALVAISKNGTPRYLPLIPAVSSLMNTCKHPPDYACFPSTINPYQGFDITKAWRKLRSAINMQKLRIHDLRHTAASNMIAQGYTLIEVAELLGHSQISTTRRYAHLANQSKALMAEVVWRKTQEAA